MGFGATSGNQLIADFLRKRNVHQAVAMYVADDTWFVLASSP